MTITLSGGAHARLLALNNAHAAELGVLDETRFGRLVAQAFLAQQLGDADAFIIALDQDADYDSPNFLWFRSRFERFVYVDRVAVDASQRGRGRARTLYQSLFDRAAAAGHDRVCCEVNIEPPNPGSDAFHNALGFAPVGEAFVPASGKRVRYFSRSLSTIEPGLA